MTLKKLNELVTKFSDENWFSATKFKITNKIINDSVFFIKKSYKLITSPLILIFHKMCINACSWLYLKHMKCRILILSYSLSSCIYLKKMKYHTLLLNYPNHRLQRKGTTVYNEEVTSMLLYKGERKVHFISMT